MASTPESRREAALKAWRTRRQRGVNVKSVSSFETKTLKVKFPMEQTHRVLAVTVDWTRHTISFTLAGARGKLAKPLVVPFWLIWDTMKEGQS